MSVTTSVFLDRLRLYPHCFSNVFTRENKDVWDGYKISTHETNNLSFAVTRMEIREEVRVANYSCRHPTICSFCDEFAGNELHQEAKFRLGLGDCLHSASESWLHCPPLEVKTPFESLKDIHEDQSFVCLTVLMKLFCDFIKLKRRNPV